MIKIFKKLVFNIESTKLQKHSIPNVISDFELGKNKNLVFFSKKKGLNGCKILLNQKI